MARALVPITARSLQMPAPEPRSPKGGPSTGLRGSPPRAAVRSTFGIEQQGGTLSRASRVGCAESKKGWRYDRTASPSRYAERIGSFITSSTNTINPVRGTCCTGTSGSRRSPLRCLGRSSRRIRNGTHGGQVRRSRPAFGQELVLHVPTGDVVERRGVCPVARQAHDVVRRVGALPSTSRLPGAAPCRFPDARRAPVPCTQSRPLTREVARGDIGVVVGRRLAELSVSRLPDGCLLALIVRGRGSPAPLGHALPVCDVAGIRLAEPSVTAIGAARGMPVPGIAQEPIVARDGARRRNVAVGTRYGDRSCPEAVPPSTWPCGSWQLVQPRKAEGYPPPGA